MTDLFTDLAEVVDPIEFGTSQSTPGSYPYPSEGDGSSAEVSNDYTPGHLTPRGEKREITNPYNEQAMKRLRLADDGTPQELTTIFMGVNGELTPKREGKLPEATTPPQRDWHRPSLPQSPLARKGSEGQAGDMPSRRTPDMNTPPLIRPSRSPKPSPVSPKVKAPPPPKPKPKSPKHLLFSPHAPSKYQVKPKTPVGSTPVTDITRPEQAPSPSPKSPKGSYLSMLNAGKKQTPESPKVVMVTPTPPPKTPILSSLMKKKESAKDTALKVFDFEDDFDFGSAPSKDRPHAAMDSFASSKVASAKPLAEPKQESVQYSTSESIDASIEAVISGAVSRSPLSVVQEKEAKSKKHKESKEKGDKKDKSKKDKHKDKDKDKSKESKEKIKDEKKETTVVFGKSSPYSFEDSFSAAIKKRDDAQKSSKGHSLPPKLFLKNAWREGEAAVTSTIRIGTEPGQAPKLVIKTENPSSSGEPSSQQSEGKKQGSKGKDKAKMKLKKKEKLKLKKKKEKLMKKKLEKKKMLQSKTPKKDDASNPKEESSIPKMNITGISKSSGLKIHLSSSPSMTPEHKGSTKEDKSEKSKDKAKKKKKDKEKDKKDGKKKKEGKKGDGKKEEKKEKKDKKDKKVRSICMCCNLAGSVRKSAALIIKYIAIKRNEFLLFSIVLKTHQLLIYLDPLDRLKWGFQLNVPL